MAKRENKRSVRKSKGTNSIVGGQKSWPGTSSKGLGEQSPKTITRAKHT